MRYTTTSSCGTTALQSSLTWSSARDAWVRTRPSAKGKYSQSLSHWEALIKWTSTTYERGLWPQCWTSSGDRKYLLTRVVAGDQPDLHTSQPKVKVISSTTSDHKRAVSFVRRNCHVSIRCPVRQSVPDRETFCAGSATDCAAITYSCTDTALPVRTYLVQTYQTVAPAHSRRTFLP